VTVRSEILRFLRDPEGFARSASDADVWLAGLEEFALPSIERTGDRSLRPAQEAAWRGLADRRAGLVLGPPGTGKTHLLSWLIIGHAAARVKAGLPARTFVSAFTRNAIGNVLDAVAKRQAVHSATAPRAIYFGSPPAAGLSSGVDLMGPGDEADLLQALAGGETVIGATTWSLYRLLSSGIAAGADGPTAPLFDLVCLDEASQMVLGHGLMALGGMAPGARVVVSGDDQQLPPVRTARETRVEGRDMGGSLYAFLKSANASEFPLEETFRLNAPLAAFPERKFYPGRYVSAAPAERLALRQDWSDGLDLVARTALNPDLPVVVFVHDGPPASTASPFEAALAARLTTALAERVVGPSGEAVPTARFWNEAAAVVSPHRAQNAAIRNALPETLRTDAFVETVDRIQGKERDAVILSYCVGDPEFALAEAEFIFSPERLNVASTRARTKLVLIVSRRLLEAVPAEQDVMDKAEILREFVFSCAPLAETVLDGPAGRRVPVQIRTRGFEGETAELDLTDEPPVQAPLPDMTAAIEGVLAAIRQVAAEGEFGSAALYRVKQALARPTEPYAEARALHLLGWVSLKEKSSRFGRFWTARPFEAPRRVYAIDLETVRSRIAVAIREAKSGRHAFYDAVRDRFAWMTPEGDDALLPVLQRLEQEGLIRFGMAGAHITLSVDAAPVEELPEETDAQPDLLDEDFPLLNRLEDMEAARINFGIFDSWTSIVDLSRKANVDVNATVRSLSRLQAAGHVMLAEDARVRSRVAEIARELRHVKQRFRSDDADRRPFLVRSLKVELRDRQKPRRDLRLEEVLARARVDATTAQAEALSGLGEALGRMWGEEAALAAFQERGLQLGLAAWRGEATPTIAVAADTGSGKTEAAGLPLIAGALADRLEGIRGVRAVLAYPRIRLAANQAQRLAGYLAACADVERLPLLTLGLQVKDVPDSFETMHSRYAEIWPQAGPNAFSFPFFGCPSCGAALNLRPGEGEDGADALVCSAGDWRFAGWIGSKAQLQARPPALFLPTADSLHQWMHDHRYGRLFGDDPDFAPPRALLADEIHLYTHIHGAQVGLALRRLLARAEMNARDNRPTVAIGMSATIGDPAQAWGRLIGRDEVSVIRPEAGETDANPRGREYFYFVQPEVESRGADIAGAATTIQSLMCVAHGMRRRTGREGGYRSLVFFDSIDKMRRLHGAYSDAEEGRELASYRISAYGDDAQGNPQAECCREPIGCDRFRDGECWWFAANDRHQRGALGRRVPGSPLRVAKTPIYSGTSSDAEALVKGADIVFATSSLEVGYDDPDITLVYQHYAPQNLASFVQRKGRGGRGLEDRPITAITLSIYSPRDSWWFRRPHEMLSPTGFDLPLNPDNAFVRRGQALSALLDGIARHAFPGEPRLDPSGEPSREALLAGGVLVERLLGPDIWAEFGVADVVAFWNAARAARLGGPTRYLGEVRRDLAWAPDLLFDTINLPALRVAGPEVSGGDREDVSLAFPTLAPGNATRRYSASIVHWRAPRDGKAPWFASSDYLGAQRVPLAGDEAALLAQLPVEARSALGGLHLDLCRPLIATLERVGWMAGAYWTAELGYSAGRTRVIAPLVEGDSPIRHDSRGELRGFLLVSAEPVAARRLPSEDLQPGVVSIDAHAGVGLRSGSTGLNVARVFWGADAEVRLDVQGSDPVSFAQIFTGPSSERPLLHGYSVETEGLRIRIDGQRLDTFVAEVQAEMEEDEGERRWRAAQFTRYLVESRARGLGLNGYEAKRGADLLVAAAGDADLRGRLNRLLKFWSADQFKALLEATRAALLSQHPLMTEARVARTADALSGEAFRDLIKACLAEVRDPGAMAGYLRSTVLHALAVRLKIWAAQVGQGDERRLLSHIRLPLQFGDDADDTITLCEAGAHGDGTMRGIIDRWNEAVGLWAGGFLSACPNAEEDALVRTFWAMRDRHDRWRAGDPRDPRALAAIALELGPTEPGGALPSSLVRILFDVETVEAESFPLYDVATDLEAVRAAAERRSGRPVLEWELATAAVGAATAGTAPILARLLAAYRVADSEGEGSLTAEARLADQAFRLAAPLCLDGCRGCVHQPSDLMADSLTEASVSRKLLQRFLAREAPR
jgi:hypothetical protein